MEYKEFNNTCEKEICLRKTIRSKRCSLQSKRKQCYQKYLKQIEKDFQKKVAKDERWEEVKIKLYIRDNNRCKLWVILTDDERFYILKNYYLDYTLYKEIDPCHIIGKGTRPDLKYELDNLVCVRRYFHSLLDQLYHPVTRKNITNDDRIKWFESARDGVRYI